MTAQLVENQQTNETGISNPLERLSELLHDDMLKVNELIIERMSSDVQLIPQLASYLIAAGGKRIRPLLTIAATRLYDYQGDRHHGLAASVEFIHTATLLHDDVIDGSEERRGKKAANLIFGNQASVLVGDFLFSRAFQLMVDDKSLEVLHILSNASAVIAEGEVMQLGTTNNLETSMNDYLEVIGGKTASLFAAACEIGPVITDAGTTAARDMSSFGYNLGMAFQIIDDVLDYSANQEKLGKTVGDDFREGKMTAPVIKSIHQSNEEEYEFWKRTIGKKEQTDSDLATAQEILKRHNAIEHGMALARTYGQKAFSALNTAPDGEIKDNLRDIISFTIDRNY